MCIRDSLMTQRMADEIKHQYSKNRQIFVYPDPAGAQRSTKSTYTDHDLLRMAGFFVKTKRKHPSVTDSVNSVNSAMKECVIDPSCKNLIRDLEQVVNKEGTRNIDKSNPALTHFSDAFRYSIDYEFPVRTPKTKTYLG